MDTSIEDIKKLQAVLEQEKEQEDFEEDFDLNFNISGEDEDLDDYESDSSLTIEDISEDKLNIADNEYLAVDCLKINKSFNLIKPHLSSEEISVINSCKDPKLKHLLVLNRAKNINLKSILYNIYMSYKQVVEQIKKLNEETHDRIEKDLKSKKMIQSRMNYPYFSVKYHSCPLNEDAIRKKAANLIPLNNNRSAGRWTVQDQAVLRRAVLFQYTQYKIRENTKKVSELLRAKKEKRPICLYVVNKKIKELEDEMNVLKKDGAESVPELSDGIIDWTLISTQDLAGRHSIYACEGMWNMYVNPSINKSSKWTESENKKLTKLAEKYEFQDWDKIAKELDTNRTAFTVCIQFRENLMNSVEVGKFDKDEDNQLIRVVNAYRIGNYIPWVKVAEHFTKRVKKQLYNRYTTYLSKTMCRKIGPFSTEEDVLLLILVRKYGQNYNTICEYIPYRTKIQLSYRYNSYLNHTVMKTGSWSLVEDNAIMNHVKGYGPKRWQLLVEEIPTRNASHYRHRYHFLKKWLEANENKSIEDIPRKPESKSNSNISLIRKIADLYKSKVPTLKEIEYKIKKNGTKPGRKAKVRYINSMVEDDLIQYFQSTHRLRTARQIYASNVTTICGTVKTLLAIMRAVLVVPSQDELNSNSNLDSLDKEILSNLFQNVYAQHSEILNGPKKKVIKIEFTRNEPLILPPNLNTLVGMRSLLLKYERCKSKLTQAVNALSFTVAKSMIKNSLNAQLNLFDSSVRELILSEQETFTVRLKTLFKWPAIMSSIQPSDSVHRSNLSEKPAATKKIGRPKKDTTKIDLMNKRKLMIREQRNANSEGNIDTNNETETCTEKLIVTRRKQIQKEIDVEVVQNVEQPMKKIKLEMTEDEKLIEDIKKCEQILLKELRQSGSC